MSKKEDTAQKRALATAKLSAALRSNILRRKEIKVKKTEQTPQTQTKSDVKK